MRLFCSGESLTVTIAPKYPKIKEKTNRIFEQHGATYAVMFARLLKLVEEHEASGKLKSWVEANQPAAGDAT